MDSFKQLACSSVGDDNKNKEASSRDDNVTWLDLKA